ncbi:MAG: antibiotic biosynthesis monooxygenase [Nitrospiraceae bacterium]|nr:MAG: antibiotic biosynthesis monooxygenase [Nitrospiraceae bacterium]
MIVAIFRNRLRPEHEAEYYPFAKQVRELAEKMPGFISQKSFKSDDGERVSIIEFASEETLRAWKEHPEHRVAQELGRTKFYSEYSVQICSLKRQYEFP